MCCFYLFIFHAIPASVVPFACRILSAKMASGGSSPPSSSRWWSDLSDECPITLEPLSTLPYPPFHLGGGISRHGGGDSPNANAMYFDGLALASYCVSRATFTNPLTREALTWEDCVRLDDYLEEHCYHDQLRQGGRMSVKEAYGLRSMVKVSGAGGGGGGATAAQAEANRQRAEALRSEAAAALRGLFIYGNDRAAARTCSAMPSATLGGVPTAGFSLHRLREGGSTSIGNNDIDNVSHHRQGYDINGDVVLSEVEGLRIIDDDAAVAFGSDEAAWREVQEAFPAIDGTAANVNTGNALPRDDVEENPERSQLLQRAKEVAAQTERKQAQKQWNEERGRQVLIEDALKRRAERLRLRQEVAAKQAAEREAEKAENEDMTRARAEIELWREEQFDMLNQMAEVTRRRKEQEEKKRKALLKDADLSGSRLGTDHSNDKVKDREAPKDKAAAEATAAERAAKKKAAKRKKERERQKVKKAAEKKEHDRLAKIEEEKQRRAEAKTKCAHCSTGILDEGFEKMGFLFCSPKCARAGAST